MRRRLLKIGLPTVLVATALATFLVFRLSGADSFPSAATGEARQALAYLSAEGSHVRSFESATNAVAALPANESAASGCSVVEKQLESQQQAGDHLIILTAKVPDEVLATLHLDSQAARLAALDFCRRQDWKAFSAEQEEIRRLDGLVARRTQELEQAAG